MTPQTTDWIDVSVTVKHGMPHWPDNPPIVLERMMDLGRGNDYFLHEAAGLDEMPCRPKAGTR